MIRLPIIGGKNMSLTTFKGKSIYEDFHFDFILECSQGTYGFACGNKCLTCSIDDCNHIYGCPIVSTTLSRK